MGDTEAEAGGDQPVSELRFRTILYTNLLSTAVVVEMV